MPRKRAGDESRHGATQPEAERDKPKVTLRLAPNVIARLKALAAEHETGTVSGVVTDLVTRAR